MTLANKCAPVHTQNCSIFTTCLNHVPDSQTSWLLGVHRHFCDYIAILNRPAKTFSQGTVKGGRRQGRQGKRWEDNIREWTGLQFARVPEGSEEQGKIEETGCEVICGVPTTLAVKG